MGTSFFEQQRQKQQQLQQQQQLQKQQQLKEQQLLQEQQQKKQQPPPPQPTKRRPPRPSLGPGEAVDGGGARIYRIARVAGMPEKVISTYSRFQDGLLVRNSVAGGIGKAYRKRASIPQGCPLSVFFMNLLVGCRFFAIFIDACISL